MITYAEIMLYDDKGDTIGFELSATQLVAVCKLLGIKYKGAGEIACYSDESLKKLIKMKGNPLAVEEL